MGPACCGSAQETGGPNGNTNKGTDVLQDQLGQMSEIGIKDKGPPQNQDAKDKDATSPQKITGVPSKTSETLKITQQHDPADDELQIQKHNTGNTIQEQNSINKDHSLRDR